MDPSAGLRAQSIDRDEHEEHARDTEHHEGGQAESEQQDGGHRKASDWQQDTKPVVAQGVSRTLHPMGKERLVAAERFITVERLLQLFERLLLMLGERHRRPPLHLEPAYQDHTVRVRNSTSRLQGQRSSEEESSERQDVPETAEHGNGGLNRLGGVTAIGSVWALTSGYAGSTDHLWHQGFAPGPASLLELMVVPFLLVVLTAACWGGRRTAALLGGRFRSSSSSTRAESGDVEAFSPVLASDVERDETARLVSHAAGEGRLSLEESEQRIDAVLRARHRHELASLVADLPAISQSPSVPRRTSPYLRVALLALAAVVTLAAALVQAVAGLWELWPVAVLVFGASTLLPRR